MKRASGISASTQQDLSTTVRTTPRRARSVAVRCPECQAAPGESCQSASGVKAKTAHRSRQRMAVRAGETTLRTDEPRRSPSGLNGRGLCSTCGAEVGVRLDGMAVAHASGGGRRSRTDVPCPGGRAV